MDLSRLYDGLLAEVRQPSFVTEYRHFLNRHPELERFAQPEALIHFFHDDQASIARKDALFVLVLHAVDEGSPRWRSLVTCLVFPRLVTTAKKLRRSVDDPVIDRFNEVVDAFFDVIESDRRERFVLHNLFLSTARTIRRRRQRGRGTHAVPLEDSPPATTNPERQLVAQLVIERLVAQGVLDADELALLHRIAVDGESIAAVAAEIGTTDTSSLNFNLKHRTNNLEPNYEYSPETENATGRRPRQTLHPDVWPSEDWQDHPHRSKLALDDIP